MGKFSESARERELFRYYQPATLPQIAGDGACPIARSSTDTALTAFAQLGALRLNAARCIISLVGKGTEHVLAEASKTISLRDDRRHSDGAQLWHGEGALRGRAAAGPILTRLLTGTADQSPLPHVIVHDLLEDDRFKNLSMVVEQPYVRSLICLPLRTSSGFVIGIYCVLDHQARTSLSEDELHFLEDIAATTMDHIEAGRAKQRHDRAEKMVRAIALYLEGGESLRDWWLLQATEGRSIQQSQINERRRRGVALSEQANYELGVQDGPDPHSDATIQGLHKQDTGDDPRHGSPLASISSVDVNMSHAEVKDPSKPSTDPKLHSGGSEAPTANTAGTSLTSSRGPFSTKGLRPSARRYMSEDSVIPGKQLQEALLSADVRKSFSRASNLLREAIDLDGVAFFDASIGSFGAGSTKDGMNQKAPGAHGTHRSPETTSSGSDSTNQLKAAIDPNTPTPVASLLAYSTRTRSSIKGHAESDVIGALSEPLLRILSKRYPYGKVFNFDDDGSMSSSDVEGNSPTVQEEPEKPTDITARKAKKRLSKQAEADAILKMIPGARSVAWFPMWDASREKWYAGAMIWSLTQTRVLTPEDELTYMAAWTNSIMAEVSRLSALVASRMKVDFVSSISHELRSPLHGILASVDFLLEDEELPPMHADMVNTINSCGKTLLDTINHVLDFAKINKRPKKKSKRPHNRTERSVQRVETENEDELSNLCNLTEEVIDSVYAGRSLTKFANKTDKSSVIVIIDIAWNPCWNFKINVGAFRRILMNLFSNGLKYTDSGFVRVAVEVDPGSLSKEGGSHPVLRLTVSDSGRGISEEFLRDHLYTPFKQEDALCIGTGLGLSIVRQVLADIRGTIEFESELGAGTTTTVSIPMRTSKHSPQADNSLMVSEIRNEVKGLRVCVVIQGFNVIPKMSEQPTGILSAEAEAMLMLKSSVETMTSQWFEMETAESYEIEYDSADVLVTIWSEATKDKIQEAEERKSTKAITSTIIVLCDASLRGTSYFTESGINVFYLRLPVTPRKLANVLHEAFIRKESPISNGDKSLPLHPSPTKLPSYLTETPHEPPAQGIIPATKSSSPRPEAARRKPSQKHFQPPNLHDEDSIETPHPSINATIPENTYKTLLVEDNPINLHLLTLYMTKLSQTHSTARNGKEALEAYCSANGDYDVIIMDVQMPVMDGLKATREIRLWEQKNGVPPAAVIALTGAASDSARQEAFSSGMDLFLTKPVRMAVLKDVMIELRQRGRIALREYS